LISKQDLVLQYYL